MLSCGVLLFVMGTSRYVRTKPKGGILKKRTPIVPGMTEGIGLDVIFRISSLVVPFNIAYSQMATTFIVQGTVMHKAFGFVDAAMMNNADAVSVLLFGYLVGSKFYPWLAHRGIKIPTTYKFAIGSGLGALAIGWAMVLEKFIKKKYDETGESISILWQSFAYILIGAGEIFAVSAAYEVAFTASPPEKKVLASAVNLFCIGGLPNSICIALYNICAPWFKNSRGTSNITRLEDYASAHVNKYFWVLFLISVAGVLVNLLPCVRAFVESVEEKATDMVKSPKTPTRPPIRERRRAEEESPLIRIKRRHAYFKYGDGPVLYKQGSMRAGPSMTKSERPKKAHRLKKSQISKLYQSESALPGVMICAEGKPIMAGALLKPMPSPATSPKEWQPLQRTHSG
jgi:POT family proton-dependent oligopeptide transporter